MFENTWETLSIGSDESGKGDFFGSPCIAAVYINEKNLENLKKQIWYKKINDSKELTDIWIKNHINEILDAIGSDYWKLSDLSVEEYLKKRIEYGNNVNTLLAIHHLKVQLELSTDSKIPRIIDGFTDKDKFWGYVNKKPNINLKLIPKSETQYLSVALASIIARYYFVIKIEKMSRETGINIPMGNSYDKSNSVIDAYKKLLAKGYTEEEIDSKLVKNHFKTLEKIKNALRKE